MGKKLDRFHKDIFFPEWYSESINEFLGEISSSGPMTFSLHSVEKVVDLVENYGKKALEEFSKVIRNNILEEEKVFEFYSKSRKITKACFRFSLGNFPIDIIIVISSGGVIITVYLTDRDDNHKTLNKKPYKKGE